MRALTRSAAPFVLIALLPAVAAAQNPEQRAAAQELLEATRMRQLMEESTEAMLHVQIDANPQLAQFEDVLRAFFDKHLSWDRLEGEFVELYVRHFSAEELRELTRFYQTDLGRKAVDLQSVLFTEGARIGQRIVQENIGELQQMIMQRAQEIQDSGPPPP